MSRLIDADALMKSWLEKPDPTMENEREKAIVAELASQVIDAINEAPTIDAEPVRHGKWEMKPDPYGFCDEIPVCSACGCTTKMRETYAYCPNCGAKMDKE